MNKYEKEFHSTSGKKFRADVYSVLAAFHVTCPAIQHAIKKLLMPGQRGRKVEIQDLDEALVSVSRAVDMARARLRGSHGANGEPEPMAEPQPMAEPEKSKSAMACDHIRVKQDYDGPTFEISSGETPTGEPEPEPNLKMVTWRLCVQINTRQIYGKKPWAAFVEWWPSGDIPENWYPIESHTQPVETVKRLPEGQES